MIDFDHLVLWLSPRIVLGSIWPDLSRYANNGRIYGAELREGMIWFNQAHINCGSHNSLNLTGALTIAVHILPLPGAGQQGIIGTPVYTKGYGLYVRHEANRDIGFHVVTPDNIRFWWIGGTLEYGESHRIIATWDTNEQKVYLDGMLISPNATGSTSEEREFQYLSIGYIPNLASPRYLSCLLYTSPSPRD